MAKKDEIDLDDFNLDDFDFDIPEFESADVDTNSRSPITRALKGAVRGVKENIKDTATLRRAVSLAFPEGYGLAADSLDSAITDTKELYDKIAGDSPELIRNSKSFGRKMMAKVGDKLPGPLAKKMNGILSDDDLNSPVKSDAQMRKEQEDSDIAALTDLMKTKTQADEKRRTGDKADQLESKAINQAQFEDTSKFLSSINKGIARLVGYQDQVDIKFKQKHLELMYRQYSAQRQLLDVMAVATEKQFKVMEEIKHNTALPEVVKVRNSELMSQMARQKLMGGMLNTVSNWTQNYRKQLMGNVQGAVSGFLSPLSEAQSMTQGMDRSDIAGWTVGKELSDSLINHVSVAASPFLAKHDKIRRGGEKLRNAFTGIPQRMNEYAQSDTEGTGTKSVLTQMLKSFLPKFSLDSRPGGDNVLDMDQPGIFDKISRRALIEVIPGLLTEIVHWTKATATGDVTAERQVYNVARGGFTGEKENLNDVSRQIMSRSEKDSIRSASEEFLKTIKGNELTPKAQRILKRKLLDEVANGRDLKPDRLADPANYAGEDPDAVDEINTHLTDVFGLDWSGRMTDTSTEGQAKFNDIRNEFIRMGTMIPAAGDRIRVLSDVLGRDNFRKLGFIENNGREDRINYNKLFDSVFDDDETTPGPNGPNPAPPGQRDPAGPPRPPQVNPNPGGPGNPPGSPPSLGDNDHLPPAIRGDGADDASGKKSTGQPIRVNLEKWLGRKSVLMKVLTSSNEQHIETVKGLQAIHALLGEWKAFGGAAPHDASNPGSAGNPGEQSRRASMFSRLKNWGNASASQVNNERKKMFANSRKILGGAGSMLGGGMTMLGGLGKLGLGALPLMGKAGGLYLKGVKGMFGLGMSGLGLAGSLAGGGLSLAGKAAGGLGSGLKWLGRKKDEVDTEGLVASGKEKFAQAKQKMVNVYLAGEKHPRLLGWRLNAKEYYDEASGKAIEKWDDIKGNVVDSKGKLVMSYEDFVNSGGLRDHKGKVLAKFDKAKEQARSLANRGKHTAQGRFAGLGDTIKGVANGTTSLALMPYKLAGRAAMGATQKAMRIFRKGKVGADVTSALTGDPEKDNVTLGVRQAQMQFEIYQLLRRKLDPEAERKGSWRQIFRSRQEKEEEKKREQVQGKYGNVQGMFGKGGLLAGLLGRNKKDAEDKEEDDDGFGLGDAADLLGGGDEGDGRRRRRRGRGGRNAPRGRMGKLWDGTKRLGGKLLDKMGTAGSVIRGVGKGLGYLGTGALALGKGAFKVGKFALNNPLTRFALKGAGRLALGTLAGVGSILSAPVVAIGLGLWTAYEIGSWMWQRYKDRLPPLSRLRIAQYGIAPRKDVEGMKQIFALEKMFSSYTRVEESGAVNINLKTIPAEQFGSVFGFKISPDDEGSMKKLEKIMQWVNGRFKAVYSAHVAQLYKLNKTLDLTVVDQKVTGQPALDMLEAVKMSDQSSLFNTMDSPFESDLTEDAGDVEDWYKTSKKDLESELEEAKKKDVADKGKPAQTSDITALNAAKATATVAAATAAATQTDKNKPISLLDNRAMTPDGKLNPSITLDMALAGGATVVSSASMTKNANQTRLDFGNPVRYKVYGLTELAESKVVQLAQLEEKAFPLVRYDNDNRASISNETELYNNFVAIFSLAGKNQDDAYVWFYRRFLVGFLKYCSSVRAKSTIDAKDAPTRLSTDDLLAVLKDMVGATGEDGTPVWKIDQSPWPGYWLNSDPASCDPNLTGLANRTPPKILSEAGLIQSQQVKDAWGALITNDPTQTNRPEGTTSSTAAQTGGSMAPEAKKDGEKSWWDKATSVLGFGGDDKTGKDAQTGQAGTPSAYGSPSANTTGSSGDGGPLGGSSAPTGAGAQMSSDGAASHMGGGSGGDINNIPMPQGDGWEANKGTILAAAKMVGVDPGVATSIAGTESGFVPNARPWKNRKDHSQGAWSSAAGYYQVINGTWKSLLNRYGSKYGINPNTTSLDPRANALMGLSYIKENYDILKAKLNRKITDTDVYLAHFLGSGGAKRFLTAPANDPAYKHVSEAQAAANRNIFFDKASGRALTVTEVYNNFSAKLAKNRKNDVAIDAAALPTGGAAAQADASAAASKEQGTSVPEQNPQDPAPMPNQDPTAKSASATGAPVSPSGPQAPSLAQPPASTPSAASTGTAGTAEANDTAPTASSPSRPSQAAQQISQQAQLADLQSSGQKEAMANAFGGVEGILRETLQVNRDQLGRLDELVEMVSSLAGASASKQASTPTPPPSRSGNSAKQTRPAPQGLVGVMRQ